MRIRSLGPRRRRRLRKLAAAALFVLCGLRPAAEEGPAAAVTPIVVGSELNFPPFALSRDGAADGFTVELWRAVAQEAGLESAVRVGPFHEILEDFKQRKIDVLINLAESRERREFAEFSVRHVTMWGAIFVRKGFRAIRSEDDLDGRALIVLNADLAEDYARARGWNRLVPVTTAAEGLALLAAGRHDAMLLGKLVGLNTLREQRIGNVKAVGAPLGFAQRFAFAVQKGDAELLARINDALASVRASGRYDAIYEKWFGALDPPPLDLWRYRWWLAGSAALVGLALLAYARERHLRSQRDHSISLLNAAFESAADGILVVGREGEITYLNQQFLQMWSVPRQLAAAGADGQLLRFVGDKLLNPAGFLARVGAADSRPGVETSDELKIVDGRVFECCSRPQFLGAEIAGRVWSFRDVTDRTHAEAQIKSSLMEKEVMLKEIHHRVKNNLQIISSLLYLQASSVADEATREVFRESRGRVRSMALVHEQLYRSERLNAIDLGVQLKELAVNIASGYGDIQRRVRLELELAKLDLDLDLAIPVSLIFNELLSNAFKHGYAGGRGGRILVRLEQAAAGGWTLGVSDDGVGLPAGFSLESAPTLGLKIVRNLAAQIHSRIDYRSGPGASFELRLPQRQRVDSGPPLRQPAIAAFPGVI